MGMIKTLFFGGIIATGVYLGMNGGCQYLRQHVFNGQKAEQAIQKVEEAEKVARYYSKNLFGQEQAKPEDAKKLEEKVKQYKTDSPKK